MRLLLIAQIMSVALCLLASLGARADKVPDILASATPSEQVRVGAIFQRVTGRRLVTSHLFPLAKASRPSDISVDGISSVDATQIFKWVLLLREGNSKAVVEQMLDTDAFYNTHLANFVSRLSNEDSAALESIDDYQILLIAGFYKNVDFRDLFSKRIIWGAGQGFNFLGQPAMTGASQIKSMMAQNNLGLQVAPAGQTNPNPNPGYRNYRQEIDGLLASDGFGKRFLDGGTNRRAVRATFDLFLCSKIESWKDNSLTDQYVGRDVDRAPGKDASIYRDTCRGCHAPMDALRGAWANYNYANRVQKLEQVQPKYSTNSHVFPDGFTTLEAEWENLLAYGAGAQDRWGFNGPKTGVGLLSFGQMITESDRFRTCMVRRVIESVCPYTDVAELEREQSPALRDFAEGFKAEGFQLKGLFRNILMSEVCR